MFHSSFVLQDAKLIFLDDYANATPDSKGLTVWSFQRKPLSCDVMKKTLIFLILLSAATFLQPLNMAAAANC